jgi:hypothetical protein
MLISIEPGESQLSLSASCEKNELAGRTVVIDEEDAGDRVALRKVLADRADPRLTGRAHTGTLPSCRRELALAGRVERTRLERPRKDGVVRYLETARLCRGIDRARQDANLQKAGSVSEWIRTGQRWPEGFDAPWLRAGACE